MKVFPTLHIQQGRILPSADGGGDAVPPAMDLVAAMGDRGCARLAIVDVDAARGQGNNRECVARLMHRFRKAVPKACIQVSGGIRSSDQAQFFLDQGATWLVVGTLLRHSPILLDQLLGRFRDQLSAAIDVSGGEVLASGWVQRPGTTVEEAASAIRAQGFKRVLFMDVPSRPDTAPDLATARTISDRVQVPCFMGGTIRTRAHIERAASVRGLQGVLVDALALAGDPGILNPAVHPCA